MRSLRSTRGWRKRTISTLSGCPPMLSCGDRIARPVGRPSTTKVKRFYEEFSYKAQSWDKERRVIAKIEWHPGDLFPRVGFIVTNMPMEPDEVTWFYIRRGTASSISRRPNTPPTGRDCRASGSATTRCGCKCTRWLTTSPPSCAASNCPRQWPTEADQDWCPCRGPRPRHHRSAGRVGSHRPHGQGDPCRDPPIASASAMRVTAILCSCRSRDVWRR